VARKRLDYRALAAEATPGDWRVSVAALQRRVAAQRVALERQGVDAGELAEWWPGGEQNPGRATSAACLLRALAHYQFAAGQRDAARAQRSERATGGDVRLQRAVAASLTDRSEPVELSVGVKRVHPKSFRTHEVLSELDQEIAALAHADLTVAEAALAAGVDPDDAPLYGLRADAVAVWCWIVTTPGAGLPYDEHAPIPEPPAWTRSLTALDVLVLAQAFRRVDHETLQIMSAAFPRSADAGVSRLSFEGFLGTYAGSKGLDPLEVTRTWAVRRVVAAAVSEHVTQAEAQARVDRAQLRQSMAPGLAHA
jgi:hypothetical protein